MIGNVNAGLSVFINNLGALFGTHAPSPVHKPGKPEDYFWDKMPENTNPNLKYNGYYHFENNTCSIKDIAAMGNANVGKIDIDGDNDYEQFKAMCSYGFHVLVMIRHIFFDSNQPDSIRLDWQERWNEVKRRIEPTMTVYWDFMLTNLSGTVFLKRPFILQAERLGRIIPTKK
jgi:hypothetical protein